jgi:hypothetical protein
MAKGGGADIKVGGSPKSGIPGTKVGTVDGSVTAAETAGIRASYPGGGLLTSTSRLGSGDKLGLGDGVRVGVAAEAGRGEASLCFSGCCCSSSGGVMASASSLGVDWGLGLVDPGGVGRKGPGPCVAKSTSNWTSVPPRPGRGMSGKVGRSSLAFFEVAFLAASSSCNMLLFRNFLTSSRVCRTGMRSSGELSGSAQTGHSFLTLSSLMRASLAHSSHMEQAQDGIMTASLRIS